MGALNPLTLSLVVTPSTDQALNPTQSRKTADVPQEAAWRWQRLPSSGAHAATQTVADLDSFGFTVNALDLDLRSHEVNMN
jgi:hypothetical protein